MYVIWVTMNGTFFGRYTDCHDLHTAMRFCSRLNRASRYGETYSIGAAK